MKTFMLSLIGLSLMFFSFTASADKVILHGSPIVIEKEADFYAPRTVVTTQDYYYFTINDTRRVCYTEVQPALVNVDAGIFRVKLGEDVVDMHCYNYSPDYFIVE